MKFKRTGAAIMAVAIAGGLVACSSSASSSSSTAADGGASAAASGAAAGGGHGGLKISVVTHGQASDPYWSVVKNGVAEAQTDTGDEVTYQAPQKFDMVEMSRLIDAEVAKKPDGLVISIPDAAALKDSRYSSSTPVRTRPRSSARLVSLARRPTRTVSRPARSSSNLVPRASCA
jgi:ABC-type sugar transport system substrate-binding protein